MVSSVSKINNLYTLLYNFKWLYLFTTTCSTNTTTVTTNNNTRNNNKTNNNLLATRPIYMRL